MSLAKFSALLVVAAVALTGCRSQPSVAAYLSDRTVSINEVERIAADLSTDPARHGEVTGDVLGSMIIRDVGHRLAAEHSVDVRKQTSPDLVARYYNVEPELPIVDLLVDTQNVLVALAAAVTPIEPDLAQQQAAYQALYFATGRHVSETYTFEQLRPVLSREVIGRAIALCDLLDDAVADSDITVNPRYAGLSYGLPVNVQLGPGEIARASIVVHLTDDEVRVKEV